MAAPLAIPGLTSRGWWGWVVATAVLTLGALGWLFVTEPRYRVGVVAVVALLAVGTVVLRRSSTTLDAEAGEVVVTRFGRTRRISLAPSTSAGLVANGGGGLLLGLRPAGSRRRSFVPVLAVTDHLEASQNAPVLRALADALERHGTGGSREAVLALRAQADHVAAGGSARTSPLAARLTYGALNAAKLGGAGGIAGHLD